MARSFQHASEKVFENRSIRSAIDSRFGYDICDGKVEKAAWLINMHATEISNKDGRMESAMEYYFLQTDGTKFKLLYSYRPYFFVSVREGSEADFVIMVTKLFAGLVDSAEIVEKNDLDQTNHLSGLRRLYVKLYFLNTSDLVKVRNEIMYKVEDNKKVISSQWLFSSVNTDSEFSNAGFQERLENVLDIREYDIPYYIRATIDLKIFVGLWYDISATNGKITKIEPIRDRINRPEPCVLAFDIETTKAPLKFPDSSCDEIMMISYMINGQVGFLIINREVVSEDVEDFEYSPKPEFEGHFSVFNEANEQSLLLRFFGEFQKYAPDIVVTYNGDAFDWPFVEARATACGLDMYTSLGFRRNASGEYKSRQSSHMDAFKWVKRDSYLPMGSHNLKACARIKLRYDPVELDPEELVPMARSKPQTVANYSVSDAVATYYLYMIYVHPFTFALCTIIPMNPDDVCNLTVLRKGSGTLCEALLMVQAYQSNIIFPNKKGADVKKFTADGHLVMSETYVGGHVEALECGVYKSDIACQFEVDLTTVQKLMDDLENTLLYSLQADSVTLDQIDNFTEVCNEIKEKLQSLKDSPSRHETPLIYHLDVGAMYPNIILTNRLQPPAIVNESVCAVCDFNRPGAKCRRSMEWVWRGELLPANKSEYQWIMQQLNKEKLSTASNSSSRHFHHLSDDEKSEFENKRLKEYCRKAYGRNHDFRTEVKKTLVCQRENSFYVDTIRAFRDRRYEYKCLLKSAKKKLAEATTACNFEQIKDFKASCVLYDSLQLAHKCILNSFYGYVMRRGSRWHSMEMAGIVCHTGAMIIKKSRELIDKIGRPLELDTDGIWCILPSSFPEQAIFKLRDGGGKVTVSYPAALLNMMVSQNFTNDQYHELINQSTLSYKVRSENTIAFEVDGPYKAIVLPSSKEEGKKLKKRYAVYNFDGSIAELKGFEIKRRGELQLIKIFQSAVFDGFLKGSSLEEVYGSVAEVANYWLDLLYSKVVITYFIYQEAMKICIAVDITDAELFDLISENRSLSKKIEEYGNQKSAPIIAAKRLAEFLGDEMIKNSGLNCRTVILKEPRGAPTSERAVPVAIFQADTNIARHFLKRWLKRCDFSENFDIREIIDWDYYIDRLGSTILKLISIPAAIQGVTNPVPRIPLPEWVRNKVAVTDNSRKQVRLNDLFQPMRDIEELWTTADEEAGKALATKKALQASKGGKKNVKSVTDEILGELTSAQKKNYVLSWLYGLKKRWMHMRRQSRKRPHEMIESDVITSQATGPTHRVDQMLLASPRNLLTRPWNIIQILKNKEPGLFTLWVSIGSELHNVRLRAPRIFYVNQRIPKQIDSTDVYRKCIRTLPRSHSVYHLYEYEVPEEKYERHLHQLNTEINAFHIEGIYETRVPLFFRVLMQLGCVCQAKPALRDLLKVPEEFKLNQLDSALDDDARYLSEDVFKTIFLYNYAQDTRSVWCLCMPNTKIGLVWIVEKSGIANHPNVSALYSQERKAKLEANSKRIFPEEDYTFKVTMETNVRQVYRSMQRALRSYHDGKHGPTMVAYISSHECDQLISLISSLSYFPVVKLRIVDGENLFSCLDWQRVGCKKVVTHFLNINSYLTTFKDLCRYMRIPLGNVPTNPTQYGSDLSYARHLCKSGHVLWCSNSDVPDFGGKEIDDHRLNVDSDDAVDSQINRAGFYKNITFELNIVSLPIAAVLSTSRILDFDNSETFFKASSTTKKTGVATLHSLNSYNNDENILLSSAFKVMKQMVHGWLKEVTLFQNVFADNHMIHFYRWLGSTDSLLFDPCLKRAVDSLMKKLYLMLIAELDQMGLQIVHADLNRVILSSGRSKYDDAVAHVDYILRTIQNKEIFSVVDLLKSKIWNLLLWLDEKKMKNILQNNYGGVEQCTTQGARTDPMHADTTTTDNIGLTMNWQLLHFLPSAFNCQESFKMIIAGYIMLIYNFLINSDLQSNSADLDNNDEQMMMTTTQPTISQGLMQQKASMKLNYERLKQFSLELLNGELSEKLFNTVRKVQRAAKLHPDTVASTFPRFVGSHLHLTNPALELAKTLCKVLSLDEMIADEIYPIKRDLLAILNVGEFAEIAEWKNPSLSMILRDFPCKQCNLCRDLDLCRDFELNSNDSETEIWRCSRCKTIYDIGEIEFRLLQYLNNFCKSYFTQDLKCEKCQEPISNGKPPNCTQLDLLKLTTPKFVD
ncbi:DNA polymerase epsilon catalytic subunit A [Trichinella britovi]|uniref:DNA polymerase epsilon catalytic subunit n=1 Tax=Trichinella britovi TaxID=45882 RepID=A0A0V1CBD9_TRIBR|nr:DNA polymerase epsilon catalytic subunit A [Trichinella britovi]